MYWPFRISIWNSNLEFCFLLRRVFSLALTVCCCEDKDVKLFCKFLRAHKMCTMCRNVRAHSRFTGVTIFYASRQPQHKARFPSTQVYSAIWGKSVHIWHITVVFLSCFIHFDQAQKGQLQPHFFFITNKRQENKVFEIWLWASSCRVNQQM